MRLRTLTFPLVVLPFIACVTSLHPIYTNAELVEEPALVGLWAETNSREVWNIAAAKDKSYRVLNFDDEGKSAAFIAHLVRIGDSVFLDVYPDRRALPGLDTYGSNFVPVHSFFQVLEFKPRLKIAAISEEWIRDRVKLDVGASLRHEVVGNDEILTGSTEELQAFLRQAVRDPRAFPSVDELIRLR